LLDKAEEIDYSKTNKGDDEEEYASPLKREDAARKKSMLCAVEEKGAERLSEGRDGEGSF